jgi:transcription antitermination factor NusG
MSNSGKCDLFSDSTPSQWFALIVKRSFDKAVAKTLETKGFQTFLPLYTKQHTYASRSEQFELPLFPGHVSCRFSAVNRLPILSTPGVMQILSSGNQLNPVDEAEIVSLRTAIKARLRIEPVPFLQVGEKARILQGALAGIEGIVVKSKQYLRLIVSMIQRSVLLEIDRVQGEILSAPAFFSPSYPELES